ncbi:SMU1112c/YaeR family gloxylase I-like metalloprotein [Mesobacillus jeotgali]|uniref:SMU1112c/YaeR family gloxylase I-like metalloprotein n=1 Tax=Mesobacillus jeotgali TaxID=129985 RepID=UPI0009A65B15|nr:VOC family protein [Mesobacillus jeotgali]
MKLEKIHHVAIICTNFEKSKEFYTKILVFQVMSEVYREERQSYKLDLRVGSHCQIELFSFPHVPERPSYPEAAGLRHLAFTVQDLSAFMNYLETQGVDVEKVRLDPLTNKQFTFFADPDGLPIELYEE